MKSVFKLRVPMEIILQGNQNPNTLFITFQNQLEKLQEKNRLKKSLSLVLINKYSFVKEFI
jgi:hypothetical protein